jgi:SsrA-binding protein
MADFAYNKKANFNYEITETLEAGVELFGFEVKAVRAGQISLDGSYVIVRGGEAFLVGATITPLQPKNVERSAPNYEPTRNRKLLFTKKELAMLAGISSKANLTIVLISVYNSGRKIKVKVGLARGKKQFDKRETIKRRDTDRELRREFKDR